MAKVKPGTSRLEAVLILELPCVSESSTSHHITPKNKKGLIHITLGKNGKACHEELLGGNHLNMKNEPMIKALRVKRRGFSFL